MSEELKEELQTNETEETTAEKPEETMADYEEHFDDANPWNRVTEYMEKQTVLPVKVEGVVNGGVIVMVEGLRGFVPASKLSLSYIEDLETYLFSQRDQIRLEVSIEQCCREIHAELERKMKDLLLKEQDYVLRNYSEIR